MIAHNGDYQSPVLTLVPEIEINYSDWSISNEDITVTASSCANVCWLNQIANGKTAMQDKYVSLEGVWALGQNFALPPDVQQTANFNEFGWWNNVLSDGSALFSPAEWVNTEYTPRSVTSYTIAFDDKRQEYAVDFTIELYNDAVLLLTDTITNNTEISFTKTLTLTENVNNIKLNITKWSHAGRCIKVAEVTTAVIESYDADVIKSMSVTEEREIRRSNSAPQGNIASNNGSFSLVNADRKFDNNNTASKLYNLIRPNCKINMYIGATIQGGGTDRIPIFSGFVKNWNVPEGQINISASCKDMISILDTTTFKNTDIQTNKTFEWWIETVLNDAGLSADQYNIDSTLSGADYIIPVGYFKTNKSHKASLQELTKGCGAVAYQDRYGIVVVESITGLSGSAQETFTRSNYITKDNQPVFSNIANRVRVKTQPLILGSVKDIYTGNPNDSFTVSASSTETFTIIFNSSPVTNQVITIDPPVSGLSINDTTLYSWGADIQITNGNGTDTSFILKATGQEYEVSGENTIQVVDDQSIKKNGETVMEWDDSFWIQKISLAEIIANNIIGSFADPSKDVTLSLNTGNPALLLGDKIGVTDLYTTIDYYLTKIAMDYNDGGFTSSYEGRK
jgi:hypothetical protein